MVCIFTSCDEIRVLVETETRFEVEVSVGNIVDDEVSAVSNTVEVEASDVDCIFSTCDEIRVLVETGEVDVWV